MKMDKEERAQKAIAAKLAKECTFKPEIKKTVKTEKQSERTSTINLEAIARKKKQAASGGDDGTAKHDQLYNLRKKQKEKTDKTNEDYEFERHGQECPFAPKLTAGNASRSQVKSEFKSTGSFS